MKTTIGSRLRYMRQTKGLSIAELSKRTEISDGAISLAERDKTSMTCGNLAKICRVLNVGCDFIVMGRSYPAEMDWDQTAGVEDGLTLRKLVLKLFESKSLSEVYKVVGSIETERIGFILGVIKALTHHPNAKNVELADNSKEHPLPGIGRNRLVN